MIFFWIILILLFLGLIVVSFVDEGLKGGIKSLFDSLKEVFGVPLQIFWFFCGLILIGLLGISFVLLILL